MPLNKRLYIQMWDEKGDDDGFLSYVTRLSYLKIVYCITCMDQLYLF